MNIYDSSPQTCQTRSRALDTITRLSAYKNLVTIVTSVCFPSHIGIQNFHDQQSYCYCHKAYTTNCSLFKYSQLRPCISCYCGCSYMSNASQCLLSVAIIFVIRTYMLAAMYVSVLSCFVYACALLSIVYT